MEDETDLLSNLCTDLVSIKRLEPALVHLFRDHRPGEWVPVAELYRAAGAPDEAIKPGLAATRLTTPSAQAGYAIVFFWDDELQWSMTAYYDASRLLSDAVT